MKNKGALLVVLAFSLLLTFSFVIAQEDTEEDKIDNAYQCLEDRVGTNCKDLTADEQAFTILALGDYEDCRNEFIENSNNGECWPSSSCKLKDTAIALLALDRINEDTTKIENWLLNQTKPASDLTWFIEIDSDKATSCDISYDGTSNSINILEDKTIEDISGSCLSLSEGNYWLEISSNCLDNEYTISCDEDFKTTLLYQTQHSSTIYVSQNVNIGSANSDVIEEVLFKCFEEGTVCNYEGSLWSAVALNTIGTSTNQYIPYLDALTSENVGLFPEAFLYVLTNSDDYFTSVKQNNFNGQEWQVGTFNNFYNTALAFMALNDKAVPEVVDAKENLFNIQEDNGCWGNIKDTGFLLYAGWSKSVPSSGGGGGLPNCQASGNYCTNFNACVNSGGQVLDDFGGCYSAGSACCSQPIIILTCSAQSGYLCNNNQICNSNEYDASEFGVCCTAQCDDVVDIEEPNECQDSGSEYNCKNSCSSGEESVSLSCGNLGGTCCVEEERNFFWIWFFSILIVVVIILILFRNKLKLLLFRIKSKFRKGPKLRTTRPAGFPMSRPLTPRHRPAMRRPIPRRKTDGDFNDVMKKLKDLGK